MRTTRAAAAVLICLSTLCGRSAPGAAAEAAPLVSAMVDPTLFRDGAVQRSERPFGSWTLVCDEIAGLGRRFCSLRSAPARSGGGFVRLDVSTGDDGQPAALLHLPFGLALADGVTVSPQRTGRAGAHRVPIALCSAVDCQAVWSLTPSDLADLNANRGLAIGLRAWRPQLAPIGARPKNPPPVVITIEGAGFADAVAHSLR